MAKRDVHVSRSSGGAWRVSQAGNTVSTHRTQDAAVTKGKTEARKGGVDLVTHGRDGRIRSKDSYGTDPNPPKDREH